MLTSFVLSWRLQLVCSQQGNVKKSEKSMKIVKIDGDNLHVFWATWGLSMKFSEKTWLMIILKVTKSTASPSLKNTHFLKNHKGGRRGQIAPSSLFRVNGLEFAYWKIFRLQLFQIHLNIGHLQDWMVIPTIPDKAFGTQ